MILSPYLNFSGDCAAAFKFYQQVLGGDITGMTTFGETPMADQVSADWRDKIVHVRLVTGDGSVVLMGCDAPPDHYDKMQGFSVSLIVDTAEEAERIFKGLSQNGRVQMPIQETFWAIRFGMFVDQFGTPWMINCEKAA